MMHLIEPVKTFLIGKSPLVGAAISATLGATSEGVGLTHAGNTAIFVALCGLAGAFCASLPKIIAARSHAKLSESEFIGKETRDMIKTLRQQAINNDRIVDIQVETRHTIQGHYQAAVWHIYLLRDHLKRAGIQDIPEYKEVDVAKILQDMDEQIKAVKRNGSS